MGGCLVGGSSWLPQPPTMGFRVTGPLDAQSKVENAGVLISTVFMGILLPYVLPLESIPNAVFVKIGEQHIGSLRQI